VTGVSTDKDNYSAGSVVYSGFMKDLSSLTGALGKDYVKQLDSLEQTTSITVWLGLDGRYGEYDYRGAEIWFAEGKPYWAMSTSNYNDSFTPPGKQLVGYTSIIEDGREAEEKKLMESIYTSMPGLEDHVEFKHVQVTIPEKAAITVGSKFPDPKSPLDGLYLVGTDTDTRSMGVTRASFSVLEMLKHMRADGML
jgi:all-trans-retinol 13,14-reductase